ncbi:MAG: hypothetical protein RIT81_14500 [Deltaproteobacteria bacterium]
MFENHRYDAGRLDDAAWRASFALDDAFGWDVLKSAHMTAAACSAMFINGIADCKVAIERMSVLQAIEFMRGVAGNVLRDRGRQYLSAAFNINVPIVDDRASKTAPELIVDRLEIARLGVEIAHRGGFDKVTWDGASNEVPSVPLTEQLGHDGLLSVVHAAHSLGLETYISAGMKAEHMRAACAVGVDGVGIGTSLHYRDAESGLMGALKPDAIAGVLDVRDAAAATPLGVAAKALARLDRMHFEGSLRSEDEAARERLYEALAKEDVAKCNAELASLGHVVAMPDNSGEHPLLAAAERIVAMRRRDERSLRLGTMEDDRRSWFLGRVGEGLRSRDVATIEEAFEMLRGINAW